MPEPVATGPVSLRLYVRDGCHLCEDFLLQLSLDLGASRDGPAVVDVDREPDLAARYGLRVPVLEAAGEVVCEGRYDSKRVREALGL